MLINSMQILKCSAIPNFLLEEVMLCYFEKYMVKQLLAVEEWAEPKNLLLQLIHLT